MNIKTVQNNLNENNAAEAFSMVSHVITSFAYRSRKIFGTENSVESLDAKLFCLLTSMNRPTQSGIPRYNKYLIINIY